ncbi:hypothetical protein PR202_ga11062 [Eleusine coracana subsp. coracana]|uniref:Serpin domain-containing protein n=1 Tax=Eleusine coracana subsp. coracana TaxID=191504 RepID=A0AAV5C863_ELECO|nr:hypothetical protein PR202_ga11062 [Eleusine coracana subsp. coracana]
MGSGKAATVLNYRQIVRLHAGISYFTLFKVSFATIIKHVLLNEQVSVVFSKTQADPLPIMKQQEYSLYMADMLHKVVIQLEEEDGITATTKPRLDSSSSSSRVDFIADHPFAFFIIEELVVEIAYCTLDMYKLRDMTLISGQIPRSGAFCSLQLHQRRARVPGWWRAMQMSLQIRFAANALALQAGLDEEHPRAVGTLRSPAKRARLRMSNRQSISGCANELPNTSSRNSNRSCGVVEAAGGLASFSLGGGQKRRGSWLARKRHGSLRLLTDLFQDSKNCTFHVDQSIVSTYAFPALDK